MTLDCMKLHPMTIAVMPSLLRKFGVSSLMQGIALAVLERWAMFSGTSLKN